MIDALLAEQKPACGVVLQICPAPEPLSRLSTGSKAVPTQVDAVNGPAADSGHVTHQ
jgi:hypothetical protein